MQMDEQLRINAPRGRVFEALNDPAILQQAIPGCEALTAISANEFTAIVAAKIGPLSTRFQGGMTVSDLDPPVAYTLTGEGKGGPAGHARIRARVELADEGPVTVMRYTVQADVGGKLAQLGGPLIERTSRKLAGEFFSRFEALIAAADGVAAAEQPASAAAPVATADRGWLVWAAAAAIAMAVAGYFVFR